jgi:archaellum component FlaC
MKEVLQKGFDNMQIQLGGMKDELLKTQKELRKSQREAKKYRELYEVLSRSKTLQRPLSDRSQERISDLTRTWK